MTRINHINNVLQNLVGGIGVEYSLVIKEFGFTTLQTTLLSIPSGFSVSDMI